MKVSGSTVLTIAALALGATTAAFAGSTPGPTNPGSAHLPTTAPPSNDGTANMPSDNKGTPHKPADSGAPDSTPGPHAGLPAKAKAYGKYCQTESKKHIAGTPGTPFSKCVTDMAKLANGQTASPRAACKNESKKHVAGTPGTPFGKCVSGGAKLLKDQKAQNS
jgi:hypothetical protein